MTLLAGPRGAPDEPAPTPEEFKALRERGRRTQVAAAALLGVQSRQVQRWEAGEAEIPMSAWKLLRRTWGYRYPSDFERYEDFERGWNPERDAKRKTIERGDVVELQPLDGPLLRATVCLDRVHDGLVDEDSYGALVTEFVGAVGAGQAYRGFVIGERVTFARANVIHLEQRVPHAVARSTGA
ncbi:XRE family transcriptional regulator [Burkholderia sp. MSMB2042]|nr:XRE family transcriptional regulator [Burkholderia savannae]KVG48278.1 XRE family transcriptional regulator [Burkholderia sp. MSMB0265]KVG84355.1 XRE family transcriptional regulator [Burkholderia sp. MSMB2040]KVG92192.1 XRE family transcriptional regulator [Burkholderia sp. MSMB2042]KVG93931.1 XRE family transcriptional regulator [Burkholderia sp. MSMB2041]KVK82791.1 XRE family transcriptional regulator [Burkholderia sp. MSMB1498]